MHFKNDKFLIKNAFEEALLIIIVDRSNKHLSQKGKLAFDAYSNTLKHVFGT